MTVFVELCKARVEELHSPVESTELHSAGLPGRLSLR